MRGPRKKKFLEAQQLFHKGKVEEAEIVLSELWGAYPHEHAVYQCLLEVYTAQKKWVEAERLILQHGETNQYQPALDEAFLQLFLAMGDVERAWEKAEKILAESPEFIDGIYEISAAFQSFGLGDAYLDKIENCNVPGLDKNIAIAIYHVACTNDYRTAVAQLEKAVQLNPANELAAYLLATYKGELIRQKKDNARKMLAGTAVGDSVKEYRDIYQFSPYSTTAQEYYLCALACKFFPPFRIYFHRNNFVGVLPLAGRAIVFMIFFLICAIYYKNDGGLAGRDQLRPVIQFFSLLVIPRYSIFPLTIQFLSFKYVPGFHLLKRPVNFLNGTLILAIWMRVLELSTHPPSNGFDFFLGAGMMLYVAMFSVADDKQIQYRNWFFGYGIAAIAIGLLSYFKIVHDFFLFFLAGGWAVPVLAAPIIEYFQKLKNHGNALNGQRLDLALLNEQKVPKLTFTVHLVSLFLAIFGVVLFFISKNGMVFETVPLSAIAIAIVLHSSTIFAFTELNSTTPDFGWLIQKNKWFGLLLLLFSIGMYAGSFYLGASGNTLLTNYISWLPGAIMLFGSWGCLFCLFYFHKNKRKTP